MVAIEEVERERCLRPLERRGVPVHAQQLAIVFDPLCTLRTRAKLDADMVNSVHVDDEDVLSLGTRRWARSVLMTKIEAVTQVFERCSFKEPSVPNLNKDERGSLKGV